MNSLRRLAAVALVAAGATGPVAAAGEATPWDLQLAQSTVAPTTVTMVNRCAGRHRFEVQKDEAMSWFLLPDDPSRRVKRGASEVVDVRIDTNGLEVGTHRGRLTVQCLDCSSDPLCSQDKDEFLVRLQVLWPAGAFDDLSPQQHRPNRVVVLLEGEPGDEHDQILEQLTGQTPLRRVRTAHLDSIAAQMAVLEWTGAPVGFFDLVQSVHKWTGVFAAQPDFVYQTLQSRYGDPYAEMQYGPRQIEAEAAHSTATGAGVTIAVIDTGLDAEQRDLLGVISEQADLIEDGGQDLGSSHGRQSQES